MGLFDHFPYTNVHELNLDWVLSMMKALEAEWEAFTAGNSLTFADPMLHDVTKTYAKNTIVLDGNGNAYVSLQTVPVGVGLGNQDYWLMVFDYEAFIEKVNKNFTVRYYRGQYRATAAMAIGDWLTVDDVLCKATAAIAVDDVLEVGVNIDHFTLEDFIKAFMQSANQLIQQYKNDIDASELLYRQQLAGDIQATTASLQAQLDAAIAGATVDSEVINARVGWDSTTYPTLGDAIRAQITYLHNEIDGMVYTPTYTTINGYFIRDNGSYVAAATLDATNLIDVSIVDRIILENTIHLDQRRICFYNELKQYVSDIQYSSADMVISVPSTAKYVAFSSGFTSIKFAVSIDRLTSFLESYYENGTPQHKNVNLIYDQFANYTNGQFATLVGTSARSDYIDVSDCEWIRVKTRMVAAAGICFYDSSYNFVSGIDNSGSVIPLNIYDIAVPDSATYVVVSYLFAAAPQVYDAGDVTVIGYVNSFDVWKNLKLGIASKYNILGSYDNITCCGDSLTWGAVYTGVGTFRQAHRPYPQILGDMLGVTSDNIAAGGESAGSWYTHYFNRIQSKTNQLAIIYLGTNLGLTETLDTDAPAADDPSTWDTTTNTGAFARIIQEFIDKGAKVMLIKCYATSGTGSADLTHTNNTITAAANRFKCGLMENSKITDLAYHYYPDLSGDNSVHYNDLGYAAFADYMIKQVGDMPTTYKKYMIPS